RMGTLVVASAGADAQAQQVISQRDRTDKGVVFLWTGSRDAETGLTQLKHARIPIFYTPDKLARGLQSRLAYHTWRERRLADGFATAPPRTALQDEAIAQALGLGRPTLSESESKRLLAAWGVGSAREHRANSAEAAVAAAEQLGFPVALKVDSRDIAHKTEAGVVRLNLRDAAQVRTAYAEILANAQACAPQTQRIVGSDGVAPTVMAGLDPAIHEIPGSSPRMTMSQGRSHSSRYGSGIIGVSVQEMVGAGVEVIIGVSCDPQLGPVLLFGSGGVMVEVYNDVALRRCPITRSEAQAMIAE